MYDRDKADVCAVEINLCGVARVLPVVLCFRDAELKVAVLQLFADGSHDVAQAEVEFLFALSAAVQRNAEVLLLITQCGPASWR